MGKKKRKKGEKGLRRPCPRGTTTNATRRHSGPRVARFEDVDGKGKDADRLVRAIA
ncbi:hypothetical protein [Variovorax sp. W6]|uniref:hypothetical protein n=1 Tax=Variovorax sp. W6 TaxID=3093895 RepID=UPI003D802F95